MIAEVKNILTSTLPAALPRLEGLVQSLFPHATPSAAFAEFSTALAAELANGSNANNGNAAVSAAVDAVADEVYSATTVMVALERWISLSTPRMEDGNNFGVSVQMTVSKELKDMREVSERSE